MHSAHCNETTITNSESMCSQIQAETSYGSNDSSCKLTINLQVIGHNRSHRLQAQCVLTSLTDEVHIGLLAASRSVSLSLLSNLKRSKLNWTPLFDEHYVMIRSVIIHVYCFKFVVHRVRA